MRQVLIASDDAHSRAWLSQAVDRLDVRITAVPVADARTRIRAESCDLLVLDVGGSPEAVLAQVQVKGAAPGMLVVVDPDALEQLSLPMGVPVDMMVRGASSEELRYRAKALLWPGEDVSEEEIVRVDDLTINLATYQVYVGGKAVDFAYLEYALFAFLVTHPGRTHTREALLQRVWGTEYFGGSRTVDVHVRRIRAKIGPELSRRLKTVRNVGYLWER
jgi:DNA-binding response OmpR family regulator